MSKDTRTKLCSRYHLYSGFVPALETLTPSTGPTTYHRTTPRWRSTVRLPVRSSTGSLQDLPAYSSSSSCYS